MKIGNFLGQLLGFIGGIGVSMHSGVAWGGEDTGSPYPGWKFFGEVAVVTTPEGGDLAAGVVLEGFPLLIRLKKDWFEFSKAKPKGEDLRFATSGLERLAYQIEDWDAVKGEANVWVRVPKIEGNGRQMLRIYAGKADAASESNGKAVFNQTNGYASVWHMGDPVVDDAGGTNSKDQGTTATAGVMGGARHLAGKQGIFGGDKIEGYPSGVGPMTTEAWFRAEQTNGTVVAWGEEKRPRKVMFNFLSPPRMAIKCYFADVEAKRSLAVNEWYQVVHTYSEKDSRVYVNGVLEGATTPVLDMPTTSRLWIGGWYNNYKFVGDIDEVRISKVVRSAEWVKLQYENQKPMQTVVGPIVQAGNGFAVTPGSARVEEGKRVTFKAEAGGALKLYWILKKGGVEKLLAVDQFSLEFEAGRVTGNQSVILQCKAVYPSGVKTKEMAITIVEAIADPVFTLSAPREWDGRKRIEVVPVVSNLGAMGGKGVGEMKVEWSAGPFAVTKEEKEGKLILKRGEKSGKLTVTATMSNGGEEVKREVSMEVTEPKKDAWVVRVAGKEEKPEEGQFYARDDRNEGTLFYNGKVEEKVDEVFLRLYADGKLSQTVVAKPKAEGWYAMAVKLRAGLIKYKVEFGVKVTGKETVKDTVENLVCGDGYLIEGQSNGLATDTREQSPAETSEWIRSYGRAPAGGKEAVGNQWCSPVWKAQKGEKAELGWWGMELAKRLVASEKMPIFMINAAAGGTRIDQHQRSESDPRDLTTIYGRMLWRVEGAKMTHGIRGVLWHQGENDQGSAGPTGGYGWESYQRLFVEMAGAWKADFPNLQSYVIFQIWLREKQRTLPELFSRMSIVSTLGVKPPGGCHFPLVGWGEFARMVEPIMARDHYGREAKGEITAANLRRADYGDEKRETVVLEFDQAVVWGEGLAGQFYLDGEKGKVESGSVSGKLLTLKLKEKGVAKKITYLKEVAWKQETLLNGANGMAALTFCNVEIGVGPVGK